MRVHPSVISEQSLLDFDQNFRLLFYATFLRFGHLVSSNDNHNINRITPAKTIPIAMMTHLLQFEVDPPGWLLTSIAMLVAIHAGSLIVES